MTDRTERTFTDFLEQMFFYIILIAAVIVSIWVVIMGIKAGCEFFDLLISTPKERCQAIGFNSSYAAFDCFKCVRYVELSDHTFKEEYSKGCLI